jgi:predicted small secreted protein
MKRIPKYAFITLAVLLTALILSACPTDAGGGDGGDGDTITITSAAQWNSAINKIKNGGNGKNYTLTIKGTVPVTPIHGDAGTFGNVTGLTITLKGSGTLSLNNASCLLNLGGSSSSEKQTLIIDGPTLQGSADMFVWSVVYVSYYAALELKNGTITGGSAGGVEVGANSSFTMSGGTISGNTKIGPGGGVAVSGTLYSRGSFTMTGGTISGNTSNSFGGGVYVSYYDSFFKTGGTISGNIADDDTEGHAVYYRSYYRDTALGAGDNISTTVLPPTPNSNWNE